MCVWGGVLEFYRTLRSDLTSCSGRPLYLHGERLVLAEQAPNAPFRWLGGAPPSRPPRRESDRVPMQGNKRTGETAKASN